MRTETHLAPSLTEEAVASADGRIAAAVTANRVRSLRKNTAPANCNSFCGRRKCRRANAKRGKEGAVLKALMELARRVGGDDTCNCSQGSGEEKDVSEN